MNQEMYQIETTHYNNTCTRISDSLIYFKRSHHREHEQIDVDVFADFWSLAFLPNHSLSLHAIFDNKEIPVVAPICCYIPMHSVVKWRLPAGELVWHAFLSTKKISTPHQEPVLLFPTLSETELRSVESIERWLKSSSAIITVGKTLSKNTIAEKTKNWIDEHYNSELLLSDFSQKLNVSNAFITKEFKKSFGITPIEYRNKKRVYKAMQLFMFSSPQANQVAHDVGFNDYSRFAKNFHQMMNAVPSDFKVKAPLDL